MKINFKKLLEKAEIPVYGTEYSAGADLKACIEKDVVISAGETVIIPTGLACEIPQGFFGMVCSRSGLAAKKGVVVLNSPGIIDADYRGELKLIMINHSDKDFVVENGMRLAQIIIVPFQKVEWTEVNELSDSTRGLGGIGSTGIK